MKNILEILEQLIGINSKINIGFFSNLCFCDEKVENLFLQDLEKNNFSQKVFFDTILISAYLCYILYTTILSYRQIFLYLIIVFFTVCLIITYFSYKYSKEKNIVSTLDKLQIILITLNINLKALYLLFNMNNNGIDYNSRDLEELIRLIAYDFILSNTLLLIKLEGNFVTHLFHLFMNLLTITLCQLYIEKNHYIYLEGVTSLMLSIIFYILRKIWYFRIRIIFSEKYKFENLFVYTNNFLHGLNGYHLNLSKDLSIFYDEKFNNFVNDSLFNEKYDLKENKIKNKQIITKLNNIQKIKNNQDLITKEKNHLINLFQII